MKGEESEWHAYCVPEEGNRRRHWGTANHPFRHILIVRAWVKKSEKRGLSRAQID